MSFIALRHSLYERLPREAVRPFSWLPFPLQRRLALPLINRVLSATLEGDEAAKLDGRCLEIRLTDLKLSRYFTWRGGRLAVSPEGTAEAAIAGDVNTFVLLASRKEDPDTLFFQRRLTIEGDTELGLTVKNLLDRFDLDQLPLEVRIALQGGGEVVRLLTQSRRE